MKEKTKAIFLDRDGTIIEDFGYAHKIEDFKLLPGAIEGLKKLSDEYLLFIITNQSGIGRGYYKESDFYKFNNFLISVLQDEGIEIRKTYFCPHAPDEPCECRKPNTKYMEEAANDFKIDLRQSWSIGDHPHDVEMAFQVGARGIYILTGHGKKHFGDLQKKGMKPTFVAENFMEAANFILENKENKDPIKKVDSNENK